MQLAKINTEIKPKPTRGEIIEALTILQMEKLGKERDALEAEANRLAEIATKQAVDFVIRHAHQLKLDLELGSIYQGRICSCQLDIRLGHDDLPAELRASITAAQKARNAVPREPKIDYIRERIRESLKPDSSQRIQSLIDSNRQALETTLETLNTKK